jgi:preprotein translocase subunit SecG
LNTVQHVVLWTAAVLNVASLVGLIGFVLLHSGRGGGLSDMFGGGGSAALGSTAAERNLNRITLVIALVWIFTTIGLGLMLNT